MHGLCFVVYEHLNSDLWCKRVGMSVRSHMSKNYIYSVACGHFVWQLTVFVCIRNHSKTMQGSAKNVCSSAKMSSASGGFAP